MRIILSDRADRDLIDIYRYLYERHESAASNFIQRIHTSFENLASFPFIGRERSSLATGLLASSLEFIWFSILSETT
jgi:plasmid stabilization system protein ParE